MVENQNQNESDELEIAIAESLKIYNEQSNSQEKNIEVPQITDQTLSHVQKEQDYYLNQLNLIICHDQQSGTDSCNETLSLFNRIFVWSWNKPKEITHTLQDGVYKGICKILEEYNDTSIMDQNMNIVSELMTLIIERYTSDSLIPIHIKALSLIYNSCSDQQKKLLLLQGVAQIVSMTLKSTNIEVIELTTSLIYDIIRWSLLTYKDQQFYISSSSLRHDDIDKSLFDSVLMRDNVSETTKDQAAISLCWLFHGIEIPVNMRRAIISRLKS
ncbi:MAG: hypothetical protein EZS28_014503 [Streblomastix strix]|uniref:Uncharacterized protein n=1 Tax=Streblomastix strix TaxID=222440 RepID=A0A5J4W5M8_9EUKA|nr:MAG: hypothetical protein EZS28_014503 [Streblomastix strix]